MRKFAFGFILIVCFSAFAQENENCEIVFSGQPAFQKMIYQDVFFSMTDVHFSGGKNVESKTDFNSSLRIIEEAKFLTEKSDFCRNMAWASFMGAVGCTAIGAFNNNLSCDTENALSDIVSNCVISLFYFPLYKSYYRNAAAYKYNRFGLIN